VLRELLAPPVLALQFLTAVPLPVSVPAGPRELGRSLIFFPLVGTLLGLALTVMDALLLRVLPVAVSTALLLIVGTLLTGGLHLDGLMDTCDGVFGGQTRERRLEIMRDSRVGSYGVLAGALQLLLKFAALVSLPGGWRWIGLVLALTCGRWAMVVVVWAFPYARSEGLGRTFKDGTRAGHVALATLLAAAVMAALTRMPYPALEPALVALGPAALVTAGLIAWATGAFLAPRLGGLTGDAYGAVNEVVEAAVLVGLLAWLGAVAPALLPSAHVVVPL
jgi:adenosylcobinamide-GDP ribazoletransferase